MYQASKTDRQISLLIPYGGLTKARPKYQFITKGITSMHNKSRVVTAIIKKVNSEALRFLTKCKGRFVSYTFYKQPIVIYLYIM